MELHELRTTLIKAYPSADVEMLDKYLSMCSVGDNCDYTEKHHILPKHAFPEFKNLSDYPWNRVDLSASNHCIAHYTFALAVDTREAWTPVCLMTNVNTKTYILSDECDIELLSSIYEESRIRLASSMVGVPRTEETKKKLSLAHRGKIVSDETKKKMSSARKGKVLTEEHKNNISKGTKGKKKSVPQTKERREFVSNQMKGNDYGCSAIRKYPLKNQIYWIWENNDRVGPVVLKRICDSYGIESTTLQHLVKHFKERGWVSPSDNPGSIPFPPLNNGIL